jgi:acetyl-CoA C-acetyltransferase
VAARRTPIGCFNGSLAALHAHELAAVVMRDMLATTGVGAEEVQEVVLGQVHSLPPSGLTPLQVLGGGQGQNPARQAALAAGLPHTRCRAGLLDRVS